MLTGRPPFVDVGYRELTDSVMLTMMQRIIAGSYSQDMPQWSSISDDAKKLIQGVIPRLLCFTLSPAQCVRLGGRVVGTLDLRSTGRGFESQPLRCRVQPWASC